MLVFRTPKPTTALQDTGAFNRDTTKKHIELILKKADENGVTPTVEAPLMIIWDKAKFHRPLYDWARANHIWLETLPDKSTDILQAADLIFNVLKQVSQKLFVDWFSNNPDKDFSFEDFGHLLVKLNEEINEELLRDLSFALEL